MPTDINSNELLNSDMVKKVKEARLKARETLRALHISHLLECAGRIDKDLKNTVENKKKSELYLAAGKYDLGKLDTQHPLYEKHKENIEDGIKECEQMIENGKKEIETINEEITSINKAIIETQDGTWKCSLDELNVLAEKTITG